MEHRIDAYLLVRTTFHGSTIHLTFQHLQAIYMTFDNTITPATADCLTYSRSISFHPRSYAPKFC